MYLTVLFAHNVLRWVALIALLLAFVNALLGWMQKRIWVPADRKLMTFAAIGVDIQVLLGVLLYFFFSPVTTTSFPNFRAALSFPEKRFFLLDHGLLMLLALAAVHFGSAQARKATDDRKKHQQVAIWFGITLLVVLIGTPWLRSLFPGL